MGRTTLFLWSDSFPADTTLQPQPQRLDFLLTEAGKSDEPSKETRLKNAFRKMIHV